MTRFFRSTDETLSQVSAQLDSAYGYPNADTMTTRTLPPASECPHDQDGNVYLAIDDTYCEFILPSQMLPQLLAAGLVHEVDEATYLSNTPKIS